MEAEKYGIAALLSAMAAIALPVPVLMAQDHRMAPSALEVPLRQGGEEELANKVDHLRSGSNDAILFDFGGVLRMNDIPLVDPEGRIIRYAFDGASGDVSYAVGGDGEFSLKCLSTTLADYLVWWL